MSPGGSFHPPGEGRALDNPTGGQVTFKVTGAESDGRVFAFETRVAPGEGPPLHTHAAEEETLYVLEGEVRFQLGDEQFTGTAGSFAFVPRGLPHTFQNVGASEARMLIHFSPAGMERFFEGFAASAERGPETFAQTGAEAGMTVVGPPLKSA